MGNIKPLTVRDQIAKYPVIQGGMGVGISLSSLAGAVAKAGGIGIISTAQIGFRDPNFLKDPMGANMRAIREELKKARAIAPKGIIGFNIMVATRNYAQYVKEAIKAGAFYLTGLKDLRGYTMEGNHPGGSLLYRLEEMTDENGGYKTGGKSLVYGLDCEINEVIFSACAAFAKESSLLIWDAGFAGEDLRPGWGHSTWQQGIAMRQAAGAERVLMTHYNWAYSDTFLRRQEELAGRMDPACIFGREGMVITL